MTHPYKLHIKLGQMEFNAEGSEALVNEQFKRFLDVLAAVGVNMGEVTKPTSPTPPALLTTPPQPRDDNDGWQPIVTTPFDPTQLQQRVFAADKNGNLSLRVLPKTESRAADSLVMILYGYRVLKDQHDVPAPIVLAAAKQSGISLDRLDRLLLTKGDYVRKGGSRKGSRYALNNQGIAYAEELVRQMLS